MSTQTRRDRRSATGMSRDTTIDIAKGIAIVAIVLGHVWRGLMTAGMVDFHSPRFEEVDTALYSWHLCVFAMLAGVFLPRAVERDGALTYFLRRAVQFSWLYVLWVLLQGGMKLLTSALVNTPTSPAQILRSLVFPDTQMWFFPFLLVMSAAAALIRPWQGGSRMVVSWIVVVLVGWFTWGWNGTVAGTLGLALAPFFWAGVSLGHANLTQVLDRVQVPLFFVVLFLTGAALLVLTDPTAPTVGLQPPTVGTKAAGVICSISLALAVILLSRLLSRTAAGSLLGQLGRQSLAIFLAQVIAAAAARVILTKLGVGSVGIHLVAGTAVGAVAPLALARLAPRVHLGWLFEAPAALMPTGAGSGGHQR